jgi:hypothetical protein
MQLSFDRDFIRVPLWSFKKAECYRRGLLRHCMRLDHVHR